MPAPESRSSSSADRPTPTGSDRTRPTPIAAAWPNSSEKMNTNDRIASMRDVAAGHVGRKTHGQRERPHEHADDLERDQQRIQPDRHAVRHQVLPVLNEAVRARAGDDDRQEGHRRQRRGHVVVARGVEPPCSSRAKNDSSGSVQHRVIEQRQHVEDRDDADQVRREDEQEERQQQRRRRCSPTSCRRSARRCCRAGRSTRNSSAFMKPDGTCRSWRR